MILTPEQWCLRTGIRVVDPDGWDRKNYTTSWNTPITREDFIKRAMFSTCMAWPNPLYDEKWIDSERLHPDYDDCLCSDSWEHGQALRYNTLPKEPAVEKKAEPTNPTETILTILKDLLPPKPAVDNSELADAAKSLHFMYESLVKAGFTADQALELTGRMLKP